MKRIHIATVGMTTEPILKGLRRYPIDGIVLLHSEETESHAMEIKEKVEAFPGIECNLVEINPFGMESILSAIVRVRKEHPHAKISINITGGTNLMAASALVAGFIVGADAHYVLLGQEGEDPSIEDLVVDLPVPKVTWDSLRDMQRRILRALAESGGSMKGAGVKLSRALGTSRQNISHHLRSLESKDLIRTTADEREKTIELTSSGWLFARIV